MFFCRYEKNHSIIRQTKIKEREKQNKRMYGDPEAPWRNEPEGGGMGVDEPVREFGVLSHPTAAQLLLSSICSLTGHFTRPRGL